MSTIMQCVGIYVDMFQGNQNFKAFYCFSCLLWVIRHMSSIMQWVSMLISILIIRFTKFSIVAGFCSGQ